MLKRERATVTVGDLVGMTALGATCSILLAYIFYAIAFIIVKVKVAGVAVALSEIALPVGIALSILAVLGGIIFALVSLVEAVAYKELSIPIPWRAKKDPIARAQVHKR